jgi:hypothetical protein
MSSCMDTVTVARSFHVISTADINFGRKREYLYISGEEPNELIMMHLFYEREFRVLM